eukprot:CAMPEP_0170519338 /NCGR_PEP_ID=MMETSP0209-20121228/4792_1 /TAXON_ID=665100 ORGANISM="Litonotus pictus, Strain P1" /NCGR_SAMPLE_ID=MMETSP0209 /ASSEMBLY_ACC=CAM_ASM_000301 /LENGTH=686 /DNA_ID=CAMNT_0010805197 /DNA_START=33 /DNA_END=2090 /DNA_ORIENTATION=-
MNKILFDLRKQGQRLFNKKLVESYFKTANPSCFIPSPIENIRGRSKNTIETFNVKQLEVNYGDYLNKFSTSYFEISSKDEVSAIGKKQKNNKQVKFIGSDNSNSDSAGFKISTSTQDVTFLGKKKSILIDWKNETEGSISINLKKHGIEKVHFDQSFGTPKISNKGDKVVFLGEAETDDPFEYKQTFGDSACRITEPRLYLLRINDKTQNNSELYSLEEVKMEGLRKEVLEKEGLNIYPTQPYFDYQDNLIVCTLHLNYKYNFKIFNNSRRTDIHLLYKEDFENYTTLTSNYMNSFPSPIPNFPGFIYLSNDKNVEPHLGYQLKKMDYSYLKHPKDTLLLDITKKPSKYFSGYQSFLNTCHGVVNDTFFCFAANVNNGNAFYLMDYVDNILIGASDMDNLRNDEVVKTDTNSDYIFLNTNSCNMLPELQLVHVNTERYKQMKKEGLLEKYFIRDAFDNNSQVKFACDEEMKKEFIERFNLFDVNKDNEEIQIKYDKSLVDDSVDISVEESFYGYNRRILKDMNMKELKYNNTYGYLVRNSLDINYYNQSNGVKDNERNIKKPLILLFHLGPIYSEYKKYLPANHLFQSMGIDQLAINYIGSFGFGADYVRELSGKAGTEFELESLVGFIKDFLKEHPEYDENNLISYGVCYSGYLSAMLCGNEKYKDLQKACIVFNPFFNPLAELW